jgi:hypothetical protein
VAGLGELVFECGDFGVRVVEIRSKRLLIGLGGTGMGMDESSSFGT